VDAFHNLILGLLRTATYWIKNNVLKEQEWEKLIQLMKIQYSNTPNLKGIGYWNGKI